VSAETAAQGHISARVAGPAERDCARCAAIVTVSLPAATLLLVDDAPAQLLLLGDALRGAGYDLRLAESGEGALAQLARVPVDLILLDGEMPGLDGFATCRRIRAEARWRDSPVILMTETGQGGDQVRVFDAGAEDYVTKPVHLPEVLAHVRTHVGLRALRRALKEELALHLDAEKQLSQSLDRAVLLANDEGRIVFSTRLAEDLLHQHCQGYEPGVLPARLRTGGHPALRVRRVAEQGHEELKMLVLEECSEAAGPPALCALGISKREAEVLFWVARGKGNAEIGVILGAAPRTIEKHVERILDKLGVDSRMAAAIVALRIIGFGYPG
jgi:DNA-binding response OmpR family regulator/DNA-binding CsgD family transcriptional regulator